MSLGHYLILLPAVLSVLVSIGLLALSLRSRERLAGALMAAFCAAMLLNSLRGVVGRFAPVTGLDFARWDRVLYAGFQFALPAAIHLIHVITGLKRGQWVYRLLYVLATLALPVALFTDASIAGARPLPSGAVGAPGPGAYVFAGISLVAGAIYLPMLARRMGQIARSQMHSLGVVVGLLGCLLLCFGDLMAGVGLVSIPTSVFAFVPLAAMGYSLLRYDLGVTRSEVVGRWPANDFAFAVLLILVALVATFIPEAYVGQSAEDALRRFFPNGLPAALSALTCFAISFAALAKGEARLGTLLFGIVCALWGFYMVDLALVASIASPARAEWVSRIDHLALVLNLPITFHMCVAVSRKRAPRWLLWASYAVAVVTLPFVFTKLYMPGVHTYWFGHFAKAGPLMSLYLGIQVPVIAYGLVLLWRARKQGEDDKTRNLARYMFYGVAGAFVLTVGAIPATNGIALYPPAHFLFAPFVLMGYGILTTRSMSFRSFLRVGLARFTVAFLLSLAFATAMVLLLRSASGYRLWVSILVISLVTAVAFDPVTRQIRAWLEGFAEGGPGAPDDTQLRALSRELASARENPARLLATEVYRRLSTVSALVLVGAPDEARLSGVRIVDRTKLPVHVWSDDPLITALRRREPQSCRPEVPSTSAGVVFDLIGDMKLVAPIVCGDAMVGLVAVGPRADGRKLDTASAEWLEAFAERVAPHVRLYAQTAQAEAADEYRLGELSVLDDGADGDDDEPPKPT